MAEYDFKAGKKRILDILNDENDIKEVDVLPNETQLHFDNGYYGWVSSIFVDIRNSTTLFADNRKTTTARIIRCFTSEIIEILNDNSLNIREIGIRGDCVYAVYAANIKEIDIQLFEKACMINSFITMLNKLLKENMPHISAGIGLATNKDLLIKAGREYSGVNASVWIGKAVTFASKLSNMALKDGKGAILMNDTFYNDVKDHCKTYVGFKDDWFKQYTNSIFGNYYSCNISDFKLNSWMRGGMNG